MAEILLSPFSNSPLRDWPHYGELIGLFVERTDYSLTVVGAASQRVAADHLVREYAATRIVNSSGILTWSEVLQRVKSASLVVANNSGLAHLAAEFGTPTLCIFGASHSPYEWMAWGSQTTVIIKETVCSPCGIDVLKNCPYGVRCLSEITAETVFESCMSRMNEALPLNNVPATCANPELGIQTPRA